jgi:alginate O-acetyltransferase complex protein AlgI
MAIACGKWFGFELPRNFNFPYIATSITDFWRRWHLSLSTWLRDYVYFPLGGSKGSAVRTYFNLMVVFLMCGLWHGATWAWLVYGLYNGVLMSLHRMWDRGLAGNHWATALRSTWLWKCLTWAGTMWLVTAGLILIRMPSWDAGAILFRSLCGADLLAGWSAEVPVWVPLLLVPVAVGHLTSGLRAKVCAALDLPAWVRAAIYVAAVVLLVTLSPGVAKTFIYVAF